MTITEKKSLQNNQSILQNLALVEELDEQAAEIISGGYITIRNRTKYDITYILDGQRLTLSPNSVDIWDSYQGGKVKIRFNPYPGRPGEQKEESILSDGGRYEFLYKTIGRDEIYFHREGEPIFYSGFNK